jgi:D-sedoheptulose 7-phosphate isomerase
MFEKNFDYKKYFKSYYKLLIDDNFFKDLKFLNKTLRKVKKDKANIYIFGNGGSSAIASHFSVDIRTVLGINCINLADPSLITCLSNDYGYDNILTTYLKASNINKSNDILILISSSAKSKNMINTIKNYRNKFKMIVTLTGNKKENYLKKNSDINFHVNSRIYNKIENIHQIILLTLIDSMKVNKIK